MLRYAIIVLVAISFMMVPAFGAMELTELDSNTTDNLNSLHMINFTRALAVGDNGVVIISNDGTIWTPHTPKVINNYNSIFFIDENNGWMVGGTNGIVRNSVDSGENWEVVSIGTDNTLNDVFFIDENNGWIVGNNGFITFTSNAGLDWTSDSITADPMTSVYFIDETNGWATLDDSIIRLTGGFNSDWSTTVSTQILNDVFFINLQVGFTVGDGGQLFKSTNGGQSWFTPTFPATTSNLTSVHFINENIGVVTGENGVLLYTEDGGETWTDDNLVSDTLNDVFFLDEDNGFVVGNTGFLASFTIEDDEPVEDTTPPTITITGDNPEYVMLDDSSYEDQGAICTDDDGTDLTSEIDIVSTVAIGTAGPYTVIYDCADAAENDAITQTRIVHVDDDDPAIILDGPTELTLNVDDTYDEEGATCEDTTEGDLVVAIDINDLDMTSVGEYSVLYDCEDTAGHSAPQLTRTITVIAAADIIPPTITITGDNPEYVMLDDSSYEDQGAICTDDDGTDLTDEIIITGNVDENTAGEYIITYDCADAAGNNTILTRTVHVDGDLPTLTLAESGPYIHEVFDQYVEPTGTTCIDDTEGQINRHLEIDYSGVNYFLLGEYTIFYDCEDTAGNSAPTESRIIFIDDTTPPEISLIGFSPMTITVGETYIEDGAFCEDSYDDFINEIDITGFVNTDTIGEYEVFYNCEDLSENPAIQVIRTVHVIDRAPVEEISSGAIVVDLNDISFSSANNGWAVGDDGSIYQTLNGGTTWFGSFWDDSGNIYAVHAIDSTHIWAVGANALVISTIDGGNVWNEFAGMSADDMSALYFIDENNGWLLDGSSFISNTANGGATWSFSNAPNDVEVNSVFFTDVNHGWIVGDQGILIETNDGGDTWNVIETSANDLNSIFLIDEDLGWAVGNDGVAIAITGSGNVTMFSTPQDDNLNDVLVINENTVIAVGDDGWLHTTNSTGIWHSNQISDGDLNAISLIDGNNILIVGDNGFNLSMTIEINEVIIPPVELEDEVETVKKKSGGGCNDCTPPTLGLDKNHKRLVDYGFTYNGNATQVEHFYTPYPLINATVGEMNLVEIIAYENGGINNMRWVQFGLGAEEIGSPLSTLEILIEVHLVTNGTDIGVDVDEIVIHDKNNLIDNDTVAAVAYAVTCQDSDDTPRCVKVDLNYSYREETFNHVMVVDVADKRHNSQSFYFNDGVKVLGESLNVPLTFIMGNKQTSQQTESLHLTLTRTDKINHIWSDEFGVQYLQISENRFDRLTPNEKYSCANDELVIKVSAKRNNICQFMPILNYEIARAEHVMNGIMTSNNYEAIQQWDHNNRALRQYESSQ